MRQDKLRDVRSCCLSLLQRIGREEQGANMIIVALGLIVMMGVSGIAIDGSNAYYQQQRMQIAADAAALGGARLLANGRDTLSVDTEIREIGFANGADTVTWHYINDGRGVHVEAARDVPTWFARVYGYNLIPVSGDSEAQFETVSATDDLFPMTFSCNCINGGESTFVDPGDDEENDGPRCPLLPIAVSERSVYLDVENEVTIEAGTVITDIFNGTQPGNFGWLSWTADTSATSLEASLTVTPDAVGNSEEYINPDNPDDHLLSVGDKVMGLTGIDNSSGVRDELNNLMTMKILVPLWDTTTASGSNAYYTVSGFAEMWITAYDLDKGIISARFLGLKSTCDGPAMGIATVNLGDGDTSRYDISFIGKDGNSWTYEVRKLWGSNDSTVVWGIDIPSCVSKFDATTPPDPSVQSGLDTGVLRWSFGSTTEPLRFTFTLDDDYASTSVPVSLSAGLTPEITELAGPDCTLTADGVDTGGDTGTGTSLAVCLPTLDFETDDSGASLVAGQVIDNEWGAWGVHVTTNSPASHPAMVFDSASPTGNDPDLGTPNLDFAGPGVGVGGQQGTPGENRSAHGKTLIISEDNDPSDPDDNGTGGKVVFTFDIGVRMDEVHIVDVVDAARAGTVRAYSDVAGSSMLVQSHMLGLGENSYQTVPVNATGVRRLEIDFPASGSIPAVVSCRNQQTNLYNIGNFIWDDADADGLQDENEPGVEGVELELYMDGQNQVVSRMRTTSRGLYRFENLPPGRYMVRIAPSNFATGGALEGSVLTGRDVGQDTLDSDFDSSTMSAWTTVPFNGGDDQTLDAGILLATTGGTTAPDRVTVDLRDSRGSRYEVRLESQSGRTWTYSVREVSGRDLSYWSLGIENCLAHISGSSPGGALLGRDSLTGFPGIKWVVNNQFRSGTFSFTLDNDYAVGSALALINGSGNVAATPIVAPDCSRIEGVIPDDGGGGGEEEDGCNFRWVDWDGATGTNLELADNMNDTSQSGTWSIGRVISPGPAITNSTLVAAALNNRVGDEFVIPLTEWTGAGYEICGFAQVRLLNFDLSSDPVMMSIQFLKGMARSTDTSPDLADYGVRDVLIVD